jgi:hypothetical protein
MDFDGGIRQRSEVGGGRTKEEGRWTGEIEGEEIRKDGRGSEVGGRRSGVRR